MLTYKNMLEEAKKSKNFKLFKFPTEETQAGKCLLYYYNNMNKIISKKDIEKYVCNELGIASRDIQAVRHLAKQNGFNILQGGRDVFHEGKNVKKGHYVFLGFEKMNPYFSLSRREEKDLDFKKLKAKFNNCCATCGSVENKPHRKTKEPTLLEKGHMDPREPMTMSNIIPQCSYCNQIYKDKFVFDRFGNIKYQIGVSQ